MVEAGHLPESGSSARPGLFASARGLAATGVSLAANRLSLLGVELSEESSRVLSLLLYGAIAVLALGTGLIFLAIFITVALWDSNRLLALGVFAALFLGAGSVAALVAMNLAKAKTTLFAASLAELRSDHSALTRQ
jgi:uncharacterized membrane protein YqjE